MTDTAINYWLELVTIGLLVSLVLGVKMALQRLKKSRKPQPPIAHMGAKSTLPISEWLGEKAITDAEYAKFDAVYYQLVEHYGEKGALCPITLGAVVCFLAESENVDFVKLQVVSGASEAKAHIARHETRAAQ